MNLMEDALASTREQGKQQPV